VKHLQEVVSDHVRQEESTYIAAIRDNFSSTESEQLATQFEDADYQQRSLQKHVLSSQTLSWLKVLRVFVFD
jgi:hypothetical protein